MTQPSLNTTFDTSLIDLSQNTTSTMDQTSSFSTTESAPSDDYEQPLTNETELSTPTPLPTNSPAFTHASQSKEKIPTRYVPTVDAYNTWAEVYDTDGNMLQSIDDFELDKLFPEFVSLASPQNKQTLKFQDRIEIVDLGCGTGRNTLRLLQAAWPWGVDVKVTGIDASSGMLERARSKIEAYLSSLPDSLPLKKWRSANFILHDFLALQNPNGPPIFLPPPHLHSNTFDALISTLVLEHFPLAPFFHTLSSLLKTGGVALVTNMHPGMGSQSQAGFVSQDEEGKAIKVRGTSWVHGVEETVEAARAAGFEILGEVREQEVTEEMVQNGVVGERGRKWVGVKVWYGFILRKVG
jgi:SAM-dependent methyltransferase